MYIAHYPPTLSFNSVIGLIIVSFIGYKLYKLSRRIFTVKKSRVDPESQKS